jgi:hypothetical protein
LFCGARAEVWVLLLCFSLGHVALVYIVCTYISIGSKMEWISLCARKFDAISWNEVEGAVGFLISCL